MPRSFKSRSTSAALIAAALALTIGLSGCGGSDESGTEAAPESASTELTGASLDAVCAGKKQVQDGLDEVGDADFGDTMAAPQVANGMDEVRKGITAITDELDQLTPEQREAIETANEEFTSSFTDIGFELAEALPKSNAQELVDQGHKELEAAFDEAYGGIKCP